MSEISPGSPASKSFLGEPRGSPASKSILGELRGIGVDRVRRKHGGELCVDRVGPAKLVYMWLVFIECK